jgi:hypothetical protein
VRLDAAFFVFGLTESRFHHAALTWEQVLIAARKVIYEKLKKRRLAAALQRLGRFQSSFV